MPADDEWPHPYHAQVGAKSTAIEDQAELSLDIAPESWQRQPSDYAGGNQRHGQ
jgi:hypothetical protein